MQEDLACLASAEWVAHFVKTNYQGKWSIIPLRAPKGETHPIRMSYSDPSQSEFVNTHFFKEMRYISQVLSWFQCPLKSVRLMKLSAGSMIKKHTDLDLSAEEGEARLHIPIITNDNVHFYVNDSEVMMAEGECWYLRLSDPHNVTNNSDVDRIHLVIDVVVNKWLENYLQQLSNESI